MKRSEAYFHVIVFLLIFQYLFVSASANEISLRKQKDITENEFFPFKDTSDSLPEKDLMLIDSIVRANRQAEKLKYLRFLAEGKIPVWYFNLNYNSLLNYNLYEGIKIGIGAETNRRLSEYFAVGGYITYGLKDKSVRHGEWLDIFPAGYFDLRIHFGYKDMNLEFGEPEFLEKRSLLNPEYYRNLLIQNMYSTKRYTAGIEWRMFDQLNTYLFTDLSDNISRGNNQFLSLHTFSATRLVRMGLQLRFSPGIEFIRDPDILIEKNVPKADWFLTLTRGLDIFDGEYSYTKMEFKGRFNFGITPASNTKVILRAGYITNQTPVTELFNGYGSYVNTFSFVAPYSFSTMRQNEFAATEFSAIHIRHEVGGKLFTAHRKFRPTMVLAQNIGIGRLDAATSTKFGMNDFRKGYYESGLEINNLLRMDFLTWGVGVYYRYGPYRLHVGSDNFAYKFGFYFKL